jgi:hypothetical protein
MRVSVWFGIAALLFLLAAPGLHALPNMKVITDAEFSSLGTKNVDGVAESTAAVTLWGTIAFLIVGCAFLAFGFYDSLTAKDHN